ncbi:MAG: VWA domain-containing protein [Deltaproteobacteria bacterium]|nr:VWA domain-containing protein [Deltaproteobacteria bacterium]
MRRVVWSVLGVCSFALLVACGTEGASEFPPTDPPKTDDGNGNGNFDTQSAPVDGGGGGTTDGNSDPSCATVKAEAKLTPVNMVVMYDQSGSMGDTTESPTFDPTKRWIPVGNAMKAFFTDPASAGMRASLSFFADATNSCNVANYSTAEVPLTALPSATLSSTIDAHAPKGDTPTRPAMQGAIAQAQAVLASHPGEKTVIVLVTDGEPYGCGINNATQSNAEIANVVTDVSAVAGTIPTYVVGVGPSVANLDAVAAAGGTTALHVSVGTPATTTAELVTAMGKIRGQLASCDFAIPAPPDGRTLDLDKVFVVRTPSGKAAETLPYDQSCKGAGWRYDDPKKPAKVILCDATCDVVKADPGGKIDVQFACVARPPDQTTPR